MRAAERERVDIIVVDNRYQPKIALKNAELLIRDGVDLVIEFQTDEAMAPAIARRSPGAHPAHRHRHSPPGGDVFRRQQLRGGPARRAPPGALGAAEMEWPRRRDAAARDRARRVAAGVTRERRAAGIREVLHDAPAWPVVSIDADGQFKTALERVRKHLRGPRPNGCWSARRTIRARSARHGRFRKPGAATAAPSSDRTPSRMLAPSCEPRTPLIASVGYFPESTATAWSGSRSICSAAVRFPRRCS